MSNESPDTIHGRMKEGAHLAGYGLTRSMENLRWLLEDGRFMSLSTGYQNVNEFLRDTKDAFKLLNINPEERKQIALLIKDLQPKASQRAIADMVGSSKDTIAGDLGYERPAGEKSPQLEELTQGAGEKSPLPWTSQDTYDPTSKARSDANKEVRKQADAVAQAEKIALYETIETKTKILVADIKTATLDSLGLPEPVDAIITDPPYPREFLPLFGELARFAGDTLKDGGSLLVMSGESHLPEVYQLLVSDKRLRYQWTMCYMTPGPATQLQGRPIASNWKPIIWLTKGKYSGARFNDVFENPIQDKRFHHWGQGEVGMSQIIERMTDKGDVVIDPFLGGGTTGACCVRLERIFYGFDIDAEAVKMARARIAKVEDDTKTQG